MITKCHIAKNRFEKTFMWPFYMLIFRYSFNNDQEKDDQKSWLTVDHSLITYTNDRSNEIRLIYRSPCKVGLFSNLKTHCTISNKWCPSSRMHTTWRLVYINAHVCPFSLSFFRTSNITSRKYFLEEMRQANNRGLILPYKLMLNTW